MPPSAPVNRLQARVTAAPWGSAADSAREEPRVMGPLVMGIVNVTPDSFSDGGHLASQEAACDHALKLVADGADVLDIGGESTRPGAALVPLDVELDRTIGLIEALRARTDCPITIDTRKPEVARAAIAAGADGWNDVSALTYASDSLAVAAQLDVPVVLMHAQGQPADMQTAPRYRDVTSEVANFLVSRIGQAIQAGIRLEHIILDPGIGFGKTRDHNLTLIRELPRIVALGRPVLFGASRKSFIGAIDRASTPATRLGGSLAAALWASQQGAALVRVHDVRETVQALRVHAACALGAWYD